MSSNNNIAPGRSQEGESTNDDMMSDSPPNRRRTIQSFYRRSSGSLGDGDEFVAPSVILPRRITMERQASSNSNSDGMLRRNGPSLRASDNDIMSITDNNNNNNGGGEYDSRSRRNLLSNSTNSNSSHNSNSNNNSNMRLVASGSRRRRRLDLDNGSTSSSNNNTLMVSFTRLNNEELQIVRKWNRRLHR